MGVMMNLFKNLSGLTALFFALGIGSNLLEASAAHAAATTKKTRTEEKKAFLKLARARARFYQ